MSEPRPRTESELVELLRSIDVRAPDDLHRKVESLIAARSPSAGRRWIFQRPLRARRSGLTLGLAAIAAVVAIAVAIGLNAGGATTLSLRQASALTLRPATVPAP